MFSQGSKLFSILFLKCPRCHKGDFLEAHPYNLGKFNKVKKSCPKCQLKYSLEPSFYYGSMYVSYAVGVAIAITVYVLTLIFGVQTSMVTLFALIVAVLVVLMPYIGAVSKSIWANIFFKYDKAMAERSK